MKTVIFSIFFIFLTYFGFAQTPDANGILYVKKGSAGNGSSWTNAIGELADALKAAKSNTAIQQIWVTAGTYKPLYSPADNNFGNAAGRENTFLLVKDVKIYGGFSGSETTLSQRNLSITANQSILSGDISDNDIAIGSGASLYIGNNSDNTYHVVISAGGVGTAELNGFTVKGGNAVISSGLNVNGEQTLANYGGGMYNKNSSPTLTNVNINGNRAFDGGGGMYNINNSSPTLTNVSINNNITFDGGGGMHNINNSSPTLTNVIINGNRTDYNGGGMHNNNSSPILTNVNINGNSSHLGGGMYNNNSSPILTNVNIIGNSNSTAFLSGAMHNINNSSPKINNSIIWGNTRNVHNQNSTPICHYSLVQGSGGSGAWVPAFGTDGGNNIDASPFFTDADGADNILGTADDDYTLKPLSPAINGGSNSLYNTNGRNLANDKDLAGNPRVYNSSGNGKIDIGAYEYQGNAVSILYVNQNVTGGDDTGSSWTNAIKELANALLVAKGNKNIKQIWVAKGTYKPMYSPEDGKFGTNQGRDNSFLLVIDVKVYGGFAGTETSLSQRDLSITANSTTLSGDFNNDDIITGKGQSLSITNNSENAYHVVISADNSIGAVLDGFTITGGNANTNATFTVSGQTIYRTAGGGMAVHGASPSLSNLKFYGNSASIAGGGMYNYDASPALNQVYFGQNMGGGMGISFGAPSLTKVVLEGNSALYGGGINISANASPILEDILLLANYASGNGGGVQVASSGTIVFNRVNFVQNETAGPGGAAFISYSSPKFVNVAFTGNSAQKGGALYAIGTLSAPQFTNCTFKANQATGGQAIYVWETAAITLNNCIVWKDASFTGNNNLEENNSSFILKNTMLQYPGNGPNITLDMVSTTLLNKDPLFGNGADNIADTADDNLNLKSGSPAINAGNNTLYEDSDGNGSNNSLTTDKDLAGNQRLVGASIDLGAFESISTLPVTLLSFQIKKENNSAVLKWETASEKDNAGFEIFRATDDKNFASIATIAGKGTTNQKSSYIWHDRHPLNGLNYYKLVQKDIDGKTEELGIKELNFGLDEDQVLLYPNPVSTQAKVQFVANTYQSISLTEISGKVLQHLSLNKTETEKAIIINHLPNGIYLLKLTGERKNTVLKMIKN